MFARLFERLGDWWAARQRRIDLEILWPICKERACDLAHAKMAFSVHAFNDDAWLRLGIDEVRRRIDALE